MTGDEVNPTPHCDPPIALAALKHGYRGCDQLASCTVRYWVDGVFRHCWFLCDVCCVRVCFWLEDRRDDPNRDVDRGATWYVQPVVNA